MGNIKLTVAYDGTRYHGFQTQMDPVGLPTVQDSLTAALEKLTGEAVSLVCAGRTDAGVHARGQVVNFHTNSSIPIDRWPLAINSLLPNDVAVQKAQAVSEDFHARFSARWKHYRYSLYNSRIPDPFSKPFAWTVFVPLDLEAMERGAAKLVGHHEFRAFCASGSPCKTFDRTIRKLQVSKRGKTITIDVEGDGFLYNMVRIIAGTLVEIGKGKMQPEALEEILRRQDRREAGPTAPPQGLCLMRVWY